MVGDVELDEKFIRARALARFHGHCCLLQLLYLKRPIKDSLGVQGKALRDEGDYLIHGKPLDRRSVDIPEQVAIKGCTILSKPVGSVTTAPVESRRLVIVEDKAFSRTTRKNSIETMSPLNF